ncbi:IS110 family transposase [Mycolicibacterium llatzerense]|uniref:IS110 family transposase n=1 Tax=Mycolicibacterium llatzerense TaxID=280871 RepID=UPI0008DD4BE0|nr:IS110 family transposase [Mycolicibacterium llatzerense]
MTEPRTQTPAAVVIGVDAHKRTHTLVAVNHLGHPLGQVTVEATDSGHAKALRWAQTTFGPEPALWAIEDVRMVSRRLERFLMDAGLTVVRVPTQVMATTRASSRIHGKSDPIDATAVAVAALRYPDLPRAFHDQLSYELKLLMDHRETLIKQRSAAINRLRWRVHQLDPQYDCGPNLKADVHRARLRDWLIQTQSGVLAEIAVTDVDDISRLTRLIRPLERDIETRVAAAAPNLLAVPGCGSFGAARLVAETANVTRFRTDAQFAMHIGVAPIPWWSSNDPHVHHGRTGNRRLNAAIHVIALSQIRRGGVGRPYFDKHIAAGDTTRGALRRLKRRLARVVFNALRKDYALRTALQPDAAVPKL